MRRVLEFTGERAGRRFALLYEALVVGGFLAGLGTDSARTGPAAERKPFDVVRREAKVSRKMKAISEDDDGDKLPTGETHRRLLPGGGTVSLDGAEHELLRRYAESCRWKVTQAEDVVDAVDDFLTAAPQRDDA